MAQFRSSAREGSFSNNQLEQPDAVRKIQTEGNRQITGMNAHQKQLQELRSISLQAQKQSQNLQGKSKQAVTNTNVEALEVKKAVSRDIWKRQLAKEEARNKNKIDTFGALSAFSKTAFDITTGFIKANKENQQKAINQFSLKYGVTTDTLRNIEALDAGMNSAEFQKSSYAQDLIKNGGSQELVEFQYNDLYKGDGYKNFVDNADVLRRQGISIAQTLYEGIDPALSPEEKRKEIARRTAEGANSANVGDKEASVEFKEKYFFPAIREAERKALASVSGDVREAVEYESRTTAIKAVNNTWDTGDGVKRIQQTLQLITDNPRAETRSLMVSAVINNPNTTEGDLSALLKTPFDDGRTLQDYPAEYKAIENAIDARQAAEQAEFVEGEKAKQLEIEVKLQEFYDQNADSWDQKDQDKIERLAEELGGLGYVSATPERTQRYVIETLAAKEYEERFTKRLENGTATVAMLDDANLPYDLDVKLRSKIQTLTSLQTKPEYAQALAQVEDEIESSVTNVSTLKFDPGKGRNNSVQWKIDQSKAEFKRLVALYSITNPGDAIRMAKDKVVTENERALTKNGAIEQGKILEYYKYLDSQKAGQEKSLEEQRNITALAADPVHRRNPKNWAQVINQENFIEQVESYRTNGESQYLNSLGAQMKVAPWEVIEFMAPVIDGVEPIDAPQGWDQIKEFVDDQDRFVLFGGTSPQAAQLRVLQRKAEQATGQSRNAPVRSVFQNDPPSKGSYTKQQVVDLAVSVGFSAADAQTVSQIAKGESGRDPTNSTERSGLRAETGEDSVGMMQINWGFHKNRGWLQKLGINKREDLFDPVLNMKAALYLHNSAKGFGDWTVYTSGEYANY